MEIAITMSENTRIARLLYQIFELQKTMDKLYVKTGQTVHELRPLSVSEITEQEQIRENISRIKTLQSDIAKIEKELNLLREERVKSKLDELTRYMRRGGFTVEDFTVSRDSGAFNKYAQELSLPHDSIIIAIIHNERFCISHERVLLTEGDRVFILSSVSSALETASVFSSATQAA